MKKHRRGVVLSLLGVFGLFALGLPPVLALLGGVVGGVTLHRSLPPKITDPESWRKFQAAYPDSVGKRKEHAS